MKPLRVKRNRDVTRQASLDAVSKGLAPPPADITQEEFTWMMHARGGVALLWRIARAQALHGVPWVKNMIAYYRPKTIALLDKPPGRMASYASHWRKMIDRL